MSSSTLKFATATLGVPRIGAHRELKLALESFWAGKSSAADLKEAGKKLRLKNWVDQLDRGISHIPSNDFSFYDHVLDTAVMLGAVPATYAEIGDPGSLAVYFAMARGSQIEAGQDSCAHGRGHHGRGVPAMEMTKWFDTNYHYIVPELSADQVFNLNSHKPIDEFLEAKAFGIHTRPVVLGPLTFLKLSKLRGKAFDRLELLPRLLPVYADLLRKLKEAGADWVQIDEPALVLDLSDEERQAYAFAYGTLAQSASVKIMLNTYFGALDENLETALALPVAGLHLDLVRGPGQLETACRQAPSEMVLSLGLIDGRNIWRSDLETRLAQVQAAAALSPGRTFELSPSCSLLHVPVDLEFETGLDRDLKTWLAFAAQKMGELVSLSRAARGEQDSAAALSASTEARKARRQSALVNDKKVQAAQAAITPAMKARKAAFQDRSTLQQAAFKLPVFPTTTIGSFPQTANVRKVRAAFDKGTLNAADYAAFLAEQTRETVRWQEEIGLDVLVHGEFERNDMVQYFGEQLSGFAFTRFGWVQSYGSRCVRPPIIFGDVSRPKPMTVAAWQQAQGFTTKIVKGMLTGPVTILNWSFVRDDVPRATVCTQIALAIRDEVLDLEKAGAKIIQIDEAALREGLPLRKAEWQNYLQWAVECFRICSSGVRNDTQIHTHMCYSDFNDILPSIAGMDADVISIETSRSKMELLDAFRTFKYPNEIGPGVYDIHSPRVPGVDEMFGLMQLASERIPPSRLWINPDCGLKTRKWDEVRPALVNMVEAARMLRRAR